MMTTLTRAAGGTLPARMGLREVRQAKVLTQRELAERAGVAEKTVVDTERGKIRPHPRTIRKLAAALGMAPEVLATHLRDRPA